jgi:small conductance mechanosensitive channel
MASVLKSVATGVILTVSFVMVLAEIGLNIAPIIASAGIVGVALGFGAQTLVKDFLSGLFMILEDQYGVGDVVDLGEAGGTVEAVGLRVTRIRDASGVVWYVRNGEVLRVGNRSQGWSTAVVDVLVAYDQDIPRVQDLILTAAQELAADETWAEKIVDPPEMAGVESVAGDAVTIRLLLKCAPNEHLAVQRELRRRVKDTFDREGIRVPVPPRPSWLEAPGAPAPKA